MKWILVALVIVVAGCSATGTNNFPPKISDAVAMQHTALSNSLFTEILKELENKGAIEWDGRIAPIKDDISSHSNPTEWAIEKFESDGFYKIENIGFWWTWNPWSSTTAATVPNTNSTRLNKWRLDRETIAIANTLVHERNHSFGLIHPIDQTRPTNMCDFSYVSGDLAESILVSIHKPLDYKLSKPMCPALCKSLENREMPHSCENES